MKNMRIQKKMIVSFSTVEYLVLAFFVYGMIALYTVNQSYRRELELLQIQSDIVSKNSAFTQTSILILCAGVVIMFVVAILFTVKLSRGMRLPAAQLVHAANRIAAGDIDVTVDYHAEDEIGDLAEAFRNMVNSLRTELKVLHRLSVGDYTVQATHRSNDDAVNQALSNLIESNRTMLGHIQTAIEQVSGASRQIAQGAESLASGSSEQAATVEHFTTLLYGVQEQAESNVQLAEDAEEKANNAGKLMFGSIESIENLLKSMQTISNNAKNITRIVRVIDDIAFQTNILALNAAVEAARAGQHGRGFAVVADEVRNLASKSADAARETASLIEGNVTQIEQSHQLVEQILPDIKNVFGLAEANADQLHRISLASQEQNNSIVQIHRGISELSTVVQSNAATAQENAAFSHEMLNLAGSLENAMTGYRLGSENTHVAVQADIPQPHDSISSVVGMSVSKY